MPAQASQDRFVLLVCGKEHPGRWLELGAWKPLKNSNTHLLELHYGWTGISIELKKTVKPIWKKSGRDMKALVIGDALTQNYGALVKKRFGKDTKTLEYLSIDIEPPLGNWRCLQKIPFDQLQFATITFEHDHYRPESQKHRIKERSRKFLTQRGYKRVPKTLMNQIDQNRSHVSQRYGAKTVSDWEDWYVHGSLPLPILS